MLIRIIQQSCLLVDMVQQHVFVAACFLGLLWVVRDDFPWSCSIDSIEKVAFLSFSRARSFFLLPLRDDLVMVTPKTYCKVITEKTNSMTLRLACGPVSRSTDTGHKERHAPMCWYFGQTRVYMYDCVSALRWLRGLCTLFVVAWWDDDEER